jgi:hypothetical protein
VKNQKSCSFIAAQTLASVRILFFLLEFLIIASSSAAQGQQARCPLLRVLVQWWQIWNRGDDGKNGGILDLFPVRWAAYVAAGMQFPFKVLMEELIDVTACVFGNMASVPNFGLNELVLVFSMGAMFGRPWARETSSQGPGARTPVCVGRQAQERQGGRVGRSDGEAAWLANLRHRIGVCCRCVLSNISQF